MKLAIVVGGWHWPEHFFASIAIQSAGADLFAVAHRHPELPIVHEEKDFLWTDARVGDGPLLDVDRTLYRKIATVHRLRALGWEYQEEPNTIGDWGFFNQWLAQHDWRRYDAILNCHDDNFVRRDDLVEILVNSDALLLAHGRYPEAPAGYVRGSFELWHRDLLDALGGQIDMGAIGLTRVGQTDSPEDLEALSEWNNTAVPLRRFMVERGWDKRIGYLSKFYRISPWLIEGERGFVHRTGGAPWSFKAGLEAFPVLESERCHTR